MKKLLSILVFTFLFAALSTNTYAQDSNPINEIYKIAEAKASVIAEEINLSENDRLILARHITAREQTLAKIQVNKQKPNATGDFALYIENANEQFKKSINALFGTDNAEKILSLYELK